MESSIKKFIIKGLFDKKDVKLSFENNVQIFIGENGLGKTTILNSLYYVLSCDFVKLSKINFREIEVHFKTDKIKFSKGDLIKYIELISSSKRREYDEYLTSKIKKEDIDIIKKLFEKSRGEQELRHDLLLFLKKKNIKLDAPIGYTIEALRRIAYEPRKDINFREIKEIISKNVTSKILYFPTYRRIEEELQNLGNFKRDNRRFSNHIYMGNEFISLENEDDNEIENVENSLIQFGMADVEKRIETITQEISKSSIVGFSRLTGDMLIQLLRGYPDLTEVEKINIEDITIILNRVGNNLSQEDKNKIIELISTNKIFETENKQLIYFLERLLGLYKSQLHYDAAIKNFKDVCNGYLNEKHYEYNESTVDLRIFRNEEDKNVNKEEVKLSQLSSGEKQIVSLFSKIYLEPDNNFIVLFDEPELSLSIFWQKKLLPDILKSERCDFLLAVTHSPFIFENELQQRTIGLKEFFSKAK